MTRTLTLMMAALLMAVVGAKAIAEESMQQASLSIPDMVCMSCEMRVEQALTAVSGVAGVVFDGEANIATVSFDANQTHLDDILAACAEAGYPATVVEATET